MFIDAIDEVYERTYDRTKHHGRIIPILQSSGTGKSRLMAEVSHEVRVTVPQRAPLLMSSSLVDSIGGRRLLRAGRDGRTLASARSGGLCLLHAKRKRSGEVAHA
jgi:hypothetical protein